TNFCRRATVDLATATTCASRSGANGRAMNSPMLARSPRPARLPLAKEWIEVLHGLVRAIVKDPDGVTVTVADLNDRGLLFSIGASSRDDYGRIIGRSHTTIQALITLTRSWAGCRSVRTDVRLADDPLEAGSFSIAYHQRHVELDPCLRTMGHPESF